MLESSSSFGPVTVAPQHVHYWVVEFEPRTAAIRTLDSVPLNVIVTTSVSAVASCPMKVKLLVIIRPAPLCSNRPARSQGRLLPCSSHVPVHCVVFLRLQFCKRFRSWLCRCCFFRPILRSFPVNPRLFPPPTGYPRAWPPGGLFAQV